jgi:hypothetical protein
MREGYINYTQYGLLYIKTIKLSLNHWREALRDGVTNNIPKKKERRSSNEIFGLKSAGIKSLSTRLPSPFLDSRFKNS